MLDFFKHQHEIYLMCRAYFDAPKKLLSDDGEKFSHDSYKEINVKVSIKTSIMVGESPFSNGIVEQHKINIDRSILQNIIHWEL